MQWNFPNEVNVVAKKETVIDLEPRPCWQYFCLNIFNFYYYFGKKIGPNFLWKWPEEKTTSIIVTMREYFCVLKYENSLEKENVDFYVKMGFYLSP